MLNKVINITNSLSVKLFKSLHILTEMVNCCCKLTKMKNTSEVKRTFNTVVLNESREPFFVRFHDLI